MWHAPLARGFTGEASATFSNRSLPGNLWRSFLMRKDVARIGGARDIDRDVAFVNVLNDSVFVDDEGRAVAIAALFVINAVVLYHRVLDIAQQREGDSDLFGKFSVGIWTVNA